MIRANTRGRLTAADLQLVILLLSRGSAHRRAYLERRLAELNRQRVSDKTPWLLVQPSGVFPLVGPVFNPGESACWTCLFDRMIRNREVKGFLDRGLARAVAVSPLARNTIGQSAIQFAALEVAKAIATGFGTELNDHIISHDLLGSTIVKHYVAARPQCPTCGRKELRDPGRAPGQRTPPARSTRWAIDQRWTSEGPS